MLFLTPGAIQTKNLQNQRNNQYRSYLLNHAPRDKTVVRNFNHIPNNEPPLNRFFSNQPSGGDLI